MKNDNFSDFAEEMATKFAEWIAEYGIYKLPNKKNKWWAATNDQQIHKKTTHELYKLFIIDYYVKLTTPKNKSNGH